MTIRIYLRELGTDRQTYADKQAEVIHTFQLCWKMLITILKSVKKLKLKRIDPINNSHRARLRKLDVRI